MHTLTLPQQARIYATAAHAAVNQTRKYTGEPYIVHPTEVAKIVESVGGTDIMVAAAYLHDVVEDTKVTHANVQEMFGNEVADLVYWLTDVSRPEDGNRAVRKNIDLLHIAGAPPAAKTIKLADIISNSRSILTHDRKFAQAYMPEKAALLSVLTEGDAGLWMQANQLVVAWNLRLPLSELLGPG